ncbi:MAG: bifunctional N(6)-L-threonylcarbamoyladenine synthase/serine/threonine protein kinase [Candidatus Aenigmatarchaeota archaeon]
MICLGIESTAHTFGVGIVEDKKILANVKDVYIPEKGGIHPIEAKKHHEKIKEIVLKVALDDAKISLDNIDVLSYSAGPGLPPCLSVGTEFVKLINKKIKKPVIDVNHCVAHIEIGKLLTNCSDPITLYVSGGNTQIIGYAAKRYNVFGETQDIGIGNAIDKFIRETINKFPGGPIMEDLANKSNKNYIELPYVVKGMDLSFSGILTAALQKYKKQSAQSKNKLDEFICDICYSFQETCYAMITEVTERALAHTGKNEVLLTGGVAASKRLQEMLKIMCDERGAKFFVCPKEFAGDNGAMIAYNGLLAYKYGQKPVKNIDFHQKWRTDDVEILWIK